ncbi:hypothetical protein LSH36_683g02013 [Paralvinella palmiformis]|uniref:VWFA domain-containing protein n=1 Tax=Paralvinella palmiformis TaxID=53620 RepID=A0AAD9J2B2_9ANNE|nr:hypothetical protein LSH36_683g02013 [Paralvinella palmiformis]
MPNTEKREREWRQLGLVRLRRRDRLGRPHDTPITERNEWKNGPGSTFKSGDISFLADEIFIDRRRSWLSANHRQMTDQSSETASPPVDLWLAAGLVDVAEKAHSDHVYDPHISRAYPKAKRLNTSEFELEENEHFNYIPVNLNMSTVHVPTNVYDESVEVLNGVDWSEALDEYFRENYQNDPTLTWQYFGSASGFFRNYPGMRWPVEGVDLFDCRTRGWYIQAATSPKDIVILLDVSGSMKGLRMEIAKATVEKILETLSDDDFFNVIKFSMTPEYVDDCFNGTLVQANADNKKRVKEALGNIRTTEIAQFDKALIEAFDLLQMVRVFTFLIGREVGDSRQVHWMACSNKGYYSHISTLADVHEHVQEPDVPTPQYDMELRRRMVDREAGNLKMRVKVHYDGMHRVSIREQHYYFTEIDGTPFSLGIALPDGYGMNWVNGLRSLDKAAERYPDVVVTASTPIVVREGDKSAVAMVVGMQMRYDKFHEFFMNTTMLCPHKNGRCNLTCASSVISFLYSVCVAHAQCSNAV